MAVTKQNACGLTVVLFCAAIASWSLYSSQSVESRLQQLENNVGQASKRSAVGAARASENRTSREQDLSWPVFIGPDGAAVYTRWGRTVCPADNELVYSGSVAGSHFDHTGGSSNYLCMPRDPQWGRYTDGASGAAYLYGGEYETVHVSAVFNHNPPCAVCRIPHRSTVYMLPGRLRCHEGWKTEYKGYLVSSHPTHKHGYDFICLDEEPEADPAGYRDENGALMYKVEAQCGSLPCPEYINNREITCAMCSK